MIKSYLLDLSFEIIGKAVVALLLTIITIITIAVVIIALLFVWHRGFSWISNYMYKDHNYTDDLPPLWKLRISGVTLAIAYFKFHKIPAVYKEAEDIADDKTTVREHVTWIIKGRDYLEES